MIVLAAATTAISCVTSYEREPGPLRERWSKVVTGWGASPLDERVTALWLLASDAGGTGGSQPLVLVYYVGSPGWHRVPWAVGGDLERVPAFVHVTSDRLELSVEYRGQSEAAVQGIPVDLMAANVFLLAPVDGVAALTPLAKLTFDVPPEDSPALNVLHEHPAIQRAVMAVPSAANQ